VRLVHAGKAIGLAKGCGYMSFMFRCIEMYQTYLNIRGSNMNKLPYVQKDIKYSIYRSVKEMNESPEGKPTYLKKFWAEFKEEQPHLAAIIINEIEAFHTAEQMGAFAHGVWLCWAALKSQAEADEMNRDWGT